MHVLVLTQNHVGAPRYGGALRVAALIEQLRSQRITVSVIRFRLASEPPSPPDAALPIHDLVMPAGYPLAPLAAVTHLLGRAADRLAAAIHRAQPVDLVQSDPPWAALSGARIARRLRVPHVLLSQNCESALAAQFSAASPARRIPGIGARIADTNVGILRWAEARSIATASLTLTPADGDRQAMAALGMSTRTVDVLPNGTRVQPAPPATRAAVRAGLGLAPVAPVVIFVGRLDYPPNQEAVSDICTLIAPACPAVTFLLVGANPPDMKTPANVLMVGEVERVEDYLSAADLSIVPIRQGSGTRIKILDSWAAGLPVLSTSAGASGLAYVDGENIVIEDDLAGFPARIMALFRAPADRTRLGDGALAAVQPYRWETLGRSYAETLRVLVGV